MSEKKLIDIYRRLRKAYGHRGWWPGETPFEVIVGAILTQNTAWTNVEKAIGNLKKARALSPLRLRGIGMAELARLIKPSGYYNIKAKRIKHFIAFLFEMFGGDLDKMFALEAPALRALLLGVNGIGPETADSIVLYAADKPAFVVDAYTKRIFGRLGFLKGAETYDDVQRMFTENIPADVALFNDYHAQIVMLGKDVCKKKPKCDLCPLRKKECKGGK